MPIPNELLEILCCPKNKTAVRLLSTQNIETLNMLITKKMFHYVSGDPVTKSLGEGLITIDGKTVYRIDDDIPIMLIEKGISLPPETEL